MMGKETEYREATVWEQEQWINGYIVVPLALETDHGLLFPMNYPTNR